MENTYNDNDLVVGLDIGTTKIATVIGYRNENGQINITGHGVSVSSGVEFGSSGSSSRLERLKDRKKFFVVR